MEYFAFEATTEERHEWLRGEVRHLPRGDYLHACLIANLTFAVHQRLVGTPWHPLGSGIQIKVIAAEFITYADLSVYHDAPSLDCHPHADALFNPCVIFVVVEAATESYDKGEKFELYRHIPSLRVYVLLRQEEPAMEVFTWDDSKRIEVISFRGMDATAEIPVIGVSLPLAEIYRGLQLTPARE